MRALAIAFTLSLLGPAATAQETQETRKVPKDSVQLTVSGCLKGRVLAVTNSEEAEVRTGPDMTGRSFRLAGKKDVMSVVKEQNGNTVRITGLIRKMDLEPGGMRFKGGRIVVGGGRSMDPSSPAVPSPTDHVVVMDVVGIQPLVGGCSR